MKMSNLFKTLRNHWKKSLFGAVVISYGINYSLDHYRILKLMRAYCEQAVVSGDTPFIQGKMRRITVILNPAANKRKAKKQFEKYCAPLLYLSGAFVSVIETEREGHAKEIIEKIDPATDAIVIAGGDGTLSETLTGLMRSRGELCRIPVGVLPLGQTNTLAGTLFIDSSKDDHIKWMAEATMAVVKGNTKPIDAFRIEVLKDEKDSAKEGKPVYGVGQIEWGIRRELKRRAESLWYLGPLSQFASLVFTGSGLHTDSTAQHHSRGLITAKLRYTAPCQGCSACYTQRPDLQPESFNNKSNSAASGSKWWNFVSLKKRRAALTNDQKQYHAIINESCSVVEEKIVNTSNLCVSTSNIISDQEKEDAPHVLLTIGPKVKRQGELLTQGLKLIKEENVAAVDKLKAKQIEITPLINDIPKSLIDSNDKKLNVKEDCLSIDNEDYEVRPIKVTVLPNSVKVFCR
ncbi:hypothetical protein O3M35_007307 [Rhynocoris fuscipes]|uniref:DAGKc domain-containing protein n=1 Tax=Rhynocoris fuscipes TaxID=488301 RepID=A0AAW1DBH3_9HEMI